MASKPRIVLSIMACLSFSAFAESAVRRPTLPTVVHIQADTTLSSQGGMVTVAYQSPEEPLVTWFVDHFPIPDNRLDFTVENNFNPKTFSGSTFFVLSREKNRKFSVCLATRNGEICLDLRTLPNSTARSENLNFPWPLFVPAPLARYRVNKDLKIFETELEDIPYNYTYSAKLLSHNPAQMNRQLTIVSSRDMNGGQADDLITISRVTSGSPGWMTEVKTKNRNENYEGVVLMKTEFHPLSGLVESCRAVRPITTYRKDHSSAFDPGFVAIVPGGLPWRCRTGWNCLITCPFVSNGPVHANLTLVRGGHTALRIDGRIQRMGDYYGQARFVVPDYSPLLHSGSFLCHVSTRQNSVMNIVRLA